MRHLVVSVPMLIDAPPSLEMGDTLVTLTHRMDARAPLETEQALVHALDRLCEREGLPRYAEFLADAACTQ